MKGNEMVEEMVKLWEAAMKLENPIAACEAIEVLVQELLSENEQADFTKMVE